MITYTSTGTTSPEVIIRYPAYFSAAAAASLSQSGMRAMQVLVYMHEVLGDISAVQLSGPENVDHLFKAAVSTEAWTEQCLQTCDRTCSLRPEGDTGVAVTIGGGPLQTPSFRTRTCSS